MKNDDPRSPRTPQLPVVVDGSEPTAVQIVWQNVWVRAPSHTSCLPF